ncbi:uncharacterized protein LOC135481064 [Liolophura sinensis]|uniref:uncharacterized protein LOC135481064 n=1 Tax=Liolophura sinensis TaxID=3198878 RepID=UPI003157FC07
MENHQELSKSDRHCAVFNFRPTTTPHTTVSSSKYELLGLVAPWIEELSDSDKSSGDSEEKEFGQFIFTTLRETVFSDPSNSDSTEHVEWLDQGDDKCEMAELWRENFMFDNSSQIRADRRLGDLSSSYPRLQTSFYRELRKKYPIAFQRFPEEDTLSNGERHQRMV